METYDIIFAGGGATACVAAGRLIAADPKLKILMVEAGPHTQDVPEHIQPARFIRHLVPGTKAVSINVGRPSESLLGRSPIVPCGHAVGGGSSVNFLVYTRAAASDYDDWETVYGNKGWGSDKLIPLLKKAETYRGEITNDTHGTSGPIKVSFSKESNNVGTSFLEVAAAYDQERGLTDDINAFTFCDKYGKWPKYVDSQTGRRSDAAHYYIYNQIHETKLTILANTRVIRVIFEDQRATGVEYVTEIGTEGSCAMSQPTIVMASHLVVLSAGAFGSPSILERSGIGGKEVLNKNGITQLVDLPGVGENYMDHIATFIPYFGNPETESMDAVFRGRDGQEAYEKQWWETGSGPLAQNGIDAGIKLRPSPQELRTMSPELDHRWETYFAKAEDKPLKCSYPLYNVLWPENSFIWSFVSYLGKDPDVPIGNYFGIGYFPTYPLATGHIHITSGLDSYGPFDFHPGYLDEVSDLVTLRWAYKKSREIARRMRYYRGEMLSGHPKFSEDSPAACQSTSQPVEMFAPEIVYTKEDDDAIDVFHRQSAETAFHSCGTCAMKPRHQGGVVDERLNVYGVENLKVADLSIMPGNVGANTYNTAIAIGEKAAVLIAQDLGIQGVTEL